MPRNQPQTQAMEVSKPVPGEDEIANGGGDGDEVMEEEQQEGYGECIDWYECLAVNICSDIQYPLFRDLLGLIVSDMVQEASSTPTSSMTWISWFCSLPGHEYFCEVSEEFIEDDFNLTGLNSMVPFWKEAMEMVLDVEPGTSHLFSFTKTF